MADGISIQIFGATELNKALKQLPAKVARQAIAVPLRDGAKIALVAAKLNVPVDTGALQKSMKVKAAKRRRGEIGISVSLDGTYMKGKGKFYGPFVEYGTSRQPAQGFLRRAYDGTKESVKAKMERDITKNIEKLAAASAR